MTLRVQKIANTYVSIQAIRKNQVRETQADIECLLKYRLVNVRKIKTCFIQYTKIT